MASSLKRFAPDLLVASCGGLGWIPFAPGTFGSLAGIPLALATGTAAQWLATATGLTGPFAAPALEVIVIAILFLTSVPIATRAASLLASKDPGPVVIDEAVALPLVLTVVPPTDRQWPVLLAAFILFRIFDILKPPPCRRLEQLPAGLGIMADDQAAAAYAAACLALARWQEWL